MEENAAPDRKCSVLIVDDEPDMRAMLQLMLSRNGCDTVEASKATEALAHIQKGRADIMLLDLRMPGASGIDLLRSLQRRNVRLPTIVVSAYISAEVAAQFKELGVLGMVAKPFKQERILSEVQRVARMAGFELELT
jgi:DNA-binding NtrC family response regulator